MQTVHCLLEEHVVNGTTNVLSLSTSGKSVCQHQMIIMHMQKI